MRDILKQMQEQILEKSIEKGIVKAADKESKMEDIKKFYGEDKVEKADQVYNTAEDNYGAELVQDGTITSDRILDLNQPNVNFGNMFTQGNFGTGLDLNMSIPTLADTDLLDGATETTTNASFNKNATKGEDTDEVTLKVGFFDKTINVSRQELSYSVVALDNILRSRLQARVDNTVSALILNADNDTADTNINSKGTAPDAGSYFLKTGEGLRKRGIDNGVVTISTLTKASFTSLLRKIPEYSDARQDLICFMDKETALLWEDVLLEELRYDASRAIIDGYFGTYKGIDFVATRWLAKVDTDGKVNVSDTAQNTRGQIVLGYKNAVLHGFGRSQQDIGTDMNSVGDMQISITSDIAVNVANNQAGLYNTAALGVVTLS